MDSFDSRRAQGMWSTFDSLCSIRAAADLLKGRDPFDERCRQIAGVIAFANRLVHLARRVEVHTRYLCPSVTAANEAGDRWVEVLAFNGGGGYRVEFWKRRSDLERPPTPERIHDFVEADAARWVSWVAYNSEAWLCYAERVRWAPALTPPKATGDGLPQK
jgi:hypothetical protein